MLRVARNDAERNNITFKGLDGVRQYDSKFFKTALDAPLYAVSAGRSLLPQCALDATGFLSDVYKRSTRAKKFLADDVQGGKSMIEMLGVLAIVGILSVSGIAGYSKAMEKFKLNKALDEYTMLTYGLLEHIDYIQKLNSENTNLIESAGLIDFAFDLNLVPNSYKKINFRRMYDPYGNIIQLFSRNNRLVIDMYLGGALDENGDITNNTDFSTKLCQTLMTDLAKPLHSSIYSLHFTHRWPDAFFGDAFCHNSSNCLTDMSLAKINEYCNCGGKICALVIEF